MKLNLSAAGLSRASGRHPWKIIGAWLGVLAVAIVLAGTLLGDALTTEFTLTNDSESMRAEHLLRDRLGEANSSIGEIVVVRSASLTVDDPAYRTYVEGLYDDLMA